MSATNQPSDPRPSATPAAAPPDGAVAAAGAAPVDPAQRSFLQ
jgi:hypothetical protein